MQQSLNYQRSVSAYLNGYNFGLDHAGNVLEFSFKTDVTPLLTAVAFPFPIQVGCTAVKTDAVSGQACAFINTGTVTSPVWSVTQVAGQGRTFTVVATTNGTTPVNVFGTGGAPSALTVLNVVSVSQDTTAANITLKQAANTVVTIAKGTAAGGVVGGTALANTVYAAGDACTVVSSSSGNSIVTITFSA